MVNKLPEGAERGTDKRYSKEAYERNKKLISAWVSDNIVTISMRLNSENEAELIAWLRSQPNKTDYLRQLVLADMKKQKEAGTYELPKGEEKKSEVQTPTSDPNYGSYFHEYGKGVYWFDGKEYLYSLSITKLKKLWKQKAPDTWTVRSYVLNILKKERWEDLVLEQIHSEKKKPMKNEWFEKLLTGEIPIRDSGVC